MVENGQERKAPASAKPKKGITSCSLQSTFCFPIFCTALLAL